MTTAPRPTIKTAVLRPDEPLTLPAGAGLLLPAGVLILEKLSELLGQGLQIGKGGLREGIILDLLNGRSNGSSPEAVAA